MSSTDIPIPRECQQLIRRGALAAVNSSGGKDSQAITILLSRLVLRDQLIVVHAPLGEVEWPGVIEDIVNTIPPHVPLIMAPVTSGKTLLERIEERGLFPSQNALGLRRDESRDHARRIPWRRNERVSVAGREIFDCLPVFELTTKEVFRVIAEAGQSPHPVYSLGLTRCSCSFCIFSSRSDLRRAAEFRPDLYANTRSSNGGSPTRFRPRGSICRS